MTERVTIISDIEFLDLWGDININEGMSRAHQFFDDITVKKIKLDVKIEEFKKLINDFSLDLNELDRYKSKYMVANLYSEIILEISTIKRFIFSLEKEGTNETRILYDAVLGKNPSNHNTFVIKFWNCVRKKHFEGKYLKEWISDIHEKIEEQFCEFFN